MRARDIESACRVLTGLEGSDSEAL
jgi:hypothetical protein